MARALSYFGYIVLPHIARAITVVILIETIFLSVFAEIYVTTSGGPGADHEYPLPRLQAGAAQL
jgi:sorbitol/mannitol transport system permease protein